MAYLRRRRTQPYKRKRWAKLIAADLKRVPCADCGGVFPPEAMDFDHRPGEVKVANVNKITNLRQLADEIKKCDVVCANCHRVRTRRRLLDAPQG